jgi:hypothetical protein
MTSTTNTITAPLVWGSTRWSDYTSATVPGWYQIIRPRAEQVPPPTQAAPAKLSPAEAKLIERAKELSRLSKLNEKFRGWDKEIASLREEIVQLAGRL